MNLNMAELMKTMQQMQEKVQESEQELQKLREMGEAGAGLVKITLSGHNEVKAIEIDDGLLGANADKEMLTDLLIAAFNDAVNKVKASSQKSMSNITGGMPLPPGFKLPF